MKRSKSNHFLFAILLGICLFSISFAEPNDSNFFFQKPENSFVYDDSHILNSNEIKLFNELSLEFSTKTGFYLGCIVTSEKQLSFIKNIASPNTAKHWNIGSKEGNGILIFVAPKSHWKDIFISDNAKEIFDEKTVINLQQKNLLPAFREHNFSQGILAFAYSLAEFGASQKNLTLNLDKNLYQIESYKISNSAVLFILFVTFLLLMAKFKGKSILHRKKQKEDEFSGNFGRSFKGGFGSGFGGKL